jgi:hypothetical protein
MRAKTRAFTLVALMLFLIDAAAKGANAPVDCTLKQLASLPIERMADGAVTVTIKVQGVDEKFLLGLDVPVSEIRGSVAEGLHLRANGLGKKSYAVEHFEIGGVKGEGTFFYTLAEKQAVPGTTGVLGLDLLSHFELELDLKHGKLNLFSPDHCAGQGVYWATSAAVIPFERIALFDRVVLNAELDGKSVRLGLPGGSQFHTALSTGVLSKIFGIPANSPDLKPVVASNPPVFRYPFKALSIGGVAMNNPSIDVYQQDGDLLCGDEWVQSGAKRCRGGVQVQLGLDEVEALRLFISFHEGVLYVTAADAHLPDP